MTKHTTGKLAFKATNPPVICSDNGLSTIALVDSLGEMTLAQEAANAARIVHTWNCHDELVDALEQLLDVSACTNGCDPSDMTCATNVARAALKLAKGE